MRRRGFLAAVAAGVAGSAAARAAGQARLEVWRDPACGCCGGWVEHMRAAGFRVEDSLVPSPAPARHRLGIPADLLSCHTAEVEGYAIEGHVPAAAVRRLLAGRPAGVRGLAVPGMPLGSPGMEVPGQPEDASEVVAFADGVPHRAFMRFRGGREA